jgi:hypothetical protein
VKRSLSRTFPKWPSGPPRSPNELQRPHPSRAREPGTAVFVESTANGMTGKFRECGLVLDGSNGYVPFFSAWFESDEYREPAPADFVAHTRRREAACSSRRCYSNDQLYWRRRRLRKTARGCSSKSTQRHPTKPSYRQAVPCSIQTICTSVCPTPPRPRSAWRSKTFLGLPIGVLKDHPQGELVVYHDLDPKESVHHRC